MSDAIPDAKQIFLEALDRQSPEELLRYLDEACGDNTELRSRVEELLRAHREVGDFLGGPPSAAPTVHQPITEKPGTVIGPYKLLQKIGEGGFGVVYMADQKEPVRRRVALKIIKPGMDTRQVIARFEAERQALAMMDHPNIAKVLDAGTTESGRPYFVMDLVKGVPITQYCDEHHLTPRQRLELFVPVCQAVQHAHQKGIIHRDIKPTNVMVAEYDDRPVPKIIDFGVAKAIEQRLTERTMFTQLGQVVGTIDYMSPEQAKLNQWDIDTRSDIYSLGVLLYELLTGETPFDRERLRSAAFDELLRIIREEEPPRPSLRLSGSQSLPSIAANRQIEPKKLTTLVRGELDWIVMKALEKDRARRYETANGFANDIQRYLNDEPVVACPPSAAYRFRKFARRNKLAFTAAAVIAISLLLGVSGTTWQMFRAIAAERLAQSRFEEAREATNEEARQRGLAEQRRTDAEEQRDLAEKRFQLALNQLESYIAFINGQQDLLRRFPTLRQNLLAQSAPFYARLLETRPWDDSLWASYIVALMRLGTVHSSIGEHQAAVEDYRRALNVIGRYQDRAVEPTDPSPESSATTSVLHLKAVADAFSAETQVEYEEVLRRLRSHTKDIEADSGFPNVLSRAESTFAEWCLLSAHWAKAADHLLYAIELNPQREQNYRSIGPLLLYTGRTEDYLHVCKDVLTRLGPESPLAVHVAQWHNNPGIEWGVLARCAEERSLNQDLQTIQRSVAGIDKGICEYRSGQFTQAAQWLGRYKDRISGDFNSVRAHLFLAMALASLGKSAEAQQALERADDLRDELQPRAANVVSDFQRSPREFWGVQFEILRREAAEVLRISQQRESSPEGEPSSRDIPPVEKSQPE